MKVDFEKLDRAFNPRVVAVIGDNEANKFRWLRGQTITGKVYSVQLNPETIKQIEAMGIQNYTSVLDIPEPIDFAIVSVPRSAAFRVLQELITKKVLVAHFYTAGFAETSTPDGKKLEQQIIEEAAKNNFHIIGPNCMGIYNPRVGLRQRPEQYIGKHGPLGFIGQSGTHTTSFGFQAEFNGMYLEKSVSFGNGIILGGADFLEYFGQDPGIKVIGMYIEGLRDGRRFMQVLREVAARKLVVIWKGGRTEAGGRSIASHTDSMAVSQAVWNAAIKQCGAVSVNDQDEMIDTVKALLSLPPVTGKRVGIVGGSGGESVSSADVFSEAGLKVATLTQESYQELGSFFTLIGGTYVNPIDTGNANRLQMKRILQVLDNDSQVDSLVLLMPMWMIGVGHRDMNEVAATADLLGEIKQTTSKPMVCVAPYTTVAEINNAVETVRLFQGHGIPVFFSEFRAAHALKNALDYYHMHQGED